MSKLMDAVLKELNKNKPEEMPTTPFTSAPTPVEMLWKEPLKENTILEEDVK